MDSKLGLPDIQFHVLRSKHGKLLGIGILIVFTTTLVSTGQQMLVGRPFPVSIAN